MDSEFYRKAKRGEGLRGIAKRLLKNRRLLLALAIGTPVLLYVAFGPRGVLKRIELARQKAELEEQIRVEEAETRRLQAESKALEGDKKAIEKTARETYGMVRPGETVYKVHKK
jgi:cell division protein FtsB